MCKRQQTSVVCLRVVSPVILTSPTCDCMWNSSLLFRHTGKLTLELVGGSCTQMLLMYRSSIRGLGSVAVQIGCSADLGLHAAQAVASPDKAAGMSPVEEHAVYNKSHPGWGAGGSPSVGGTLLEMDKVPDGALDAAGPSNVAQPGSASSSEVGHLGGLILCDLGKLTRGSLQPILSNWMAEALNPDGRLAVRHITCC